MAQPSAACSPRVVVGSTGSSLPNSPPSRLPARWLSTFVRLSSGCVTGRCPGALVIDRNVLEWRLDPSSPHRMKEADRADRRVVIVCNEGYSSSLAAHTLQRLGLVNATDLRGGHQAWTAWKALPPESRA
jgi:rhodanese-related sulfurtransferase